MLRASSALITPICAKPRAAPPPSARPTRKGRGGLTTGGVVDSAGGAVLPAVLSAGLTGSGDLLPPGIAQALSRADAAATEKVRRERRGEDGFNEFSSSGRRAAAHI